MCWGRQNRVALGDADRPELESFAAGKELAALDEHQVRTWRSWQRWSALAILAYAFLSVMAATEPPPPDGSTNPEPAPATISDKPLLTNDHEVLLP
jgi:hypothetical protein